MEKKETIVEYSGLSMDEYVEKLHEQRDQIIEDFAKAYLGELKLKPSEIELVHRQTKNGTVIENIFEFRRKGINNEESTN